MVNGKYSVVKIQRYYGNRQNFITETQPIQKRLSASGKQKLLIGVGKKNGSDFPIESHNRYKE
jgi:hypothetical protein